MQRTAQSCVSEQKTGFFIGVEYRRYQIGIKNRSPLAVGAIYIKSDLVRSRRTTLPGVHRGPPARRTAFPGVPRGRATLAHAQRRSAGDVERPQAGGKRRACACVRRGAAGGAPAARGECVSVAAIGAAGPRTVSAASALPGPNGRRSPALG